MEWLASKSGGATGVRRLLTQRGWQVQESRHGPLRLFTGTAPAPGQRPSPRTFQDRLGDTELRLAADWGAFSGEHIDDGTRLLFEAAVRTGSHESAADIGTGYGPLALALAVTGVARTVAATDVDSPSLALASLNAEAQGAEVSLQFTDDPEAIAETSLTLCNFPTHAHRLHAERLLAGLLSRAAHGILLIVVHGSLERAFMDRMSSGPRRGAVVERRTHSVIRVG